MAGQGRKGDNLWTCSIVALNPDTGKLVWYFQGSPHDTHDWDNTETPVLFDAEIDGKPRKLLAQAARNGYFFVLDRTNGKNLLSKPYVPLNWSKGVDAKGQPIPDERKEPTVDGSLISMYGGGATNWMPPSFSPQTGLFYVNATRGFSVTYLTDTSDRPEGYGGSGRGLWSQNVLEALDYKTGEVKWSHPYTRLRRLRSRPGRPGHFDHRRQPSLYRRLQRQSDRLRRDPRKHLVAFPDAALAEQRPRDLHARRTAISGRRSGRYAVCVCAGPLTSRQRMRSFE